jgi:diaminopimelate decarboxylase
MGNGTSTPQPARALPTVEDVRDWRRVARRAVELCGTPAYITRQRPIEAALEQLEGGYGTTVRSWLSFKTHPLPALLTWWLETGRGVEVVSEAELLTARRLGCSADQLLVNGVAKQSWLGRHPIERLRVHFDSPGEVEALLPVSVRFAWRVGVRVHVPDERDGSDERFGGQFGQTAEEAVSSLRRLRGAGANVESIHFHLGQRPPAPDAYRRAVYELARVCRAAAFRPRFVDCGGALPAPGEAASALAGLHEAIAEVWSEFQPELEQVWLENGRFVTEQSSVLAVRVLDVKERPECRYVICDGGRTNHALAADRSPHALLTMDDHPPAQRLTTVCGPTCMTDDKLGRFQLPETVGVGDVLLWTDAGAYHLPWETRFSHGLCAVAWCGGDDIPAVAREREQPDQWGMRWV